MPDPVEEIWIAKGDVFRTGAYLLPDVLQNHVLLDHPEHALVNRNNRAMAAHVFTTAAGLRIAHNPPLVLAHIQLRILRQGRQSRALRGYKLLPGQRDCGFRLGCRTRGRSIGHQSSHQRAQSRLVLASQDGVHAQPAQVFLIHRRVQAVTNDMCPLV